MTETTSTIQQPASALAVFITAIDQALPQTQCTRCGYPDCRRYAEAVADGSAAINQCPPGGQEGVRRLATITGRPELPLNPENGLEAPRVVARIDESWCIGCTLCIKACPTDAILGANKRMHTIIADACTGCELCLPVCPVDCIELDNASGDATGWAAWSDAQAAQARDRYQTHSNKLALDARQQPKLPETSAAPATKAGAPTASSPSAAAPSPTPSKVSAPAGAISQPPAADATADKKATIAAILAKARQQRGKPV